MKKILIAIPTLNSIPIEFFLSMVNLKAVDQTEISVVANSLVYTARNALALKAIDEGFDWILWLDSDMVFPRDTLVNLMECAEKNNLDYVCGLMFTRAMPCEPVFYKQVVWEQDPKTGAVVKHGAEKYFDYPKNNRPFSIAGSGMGCVLGKTSVIRDVAAKFQCSPFEPMPFLGEDISFCWRLGRLGYKLYCDSRVKVGHVGSYVFNEETFKESEAKKNADSGEPV